MTTWLRESACRVARVTAPRARRSPPTAIVNVSPPPQALVAGAGLEAILVGVGPDLRYLTGYPAMPLERLTMLVIPAQGDLALVVPRLEATPARSCPAAAAGDLAVVTWEEGDDAYALVARMVHNAVAAARGVIAAARGLGQRLAVSDDLAARHLLPIQAARIPDAGRARIADASGVAHRQGPRRDRDAPPCRARRRPGRGRDRRWTTRRSHRGGRRARSPRTSRRRGPRRGDLRDRRVGAQFGVAAPRRFRPGHPGRRTDRPRHRRHDRRLRLGHHADAVGHRRRRGAGPGRAFPPPVRRPAQRPGGGDACGSAGCRARRGRRRGEASDRGGGLRRRLLPPDRARHRPRGPRGPVHHRRQPRAASRGDGLLDRARDLPRRRIRRPDRGHRRLRPRRRRSRSTRRHASCTSSTADPTAEPGPSRAYFEPRTPPST